MPYSGRHCFRFEIARKIAVFTEAHSRPDGRAAVAGRPFSVELKAEHTAARHERGHGRRGSRGVAKHAAARSHFAFPTGRCEDSSVVGGMIINFQVPNTEAAHRFGRATGQESCEAGLVALASNRYCWWTDPPSLYRTTISICDKTRDGGLLLKTVG